MERKGNGIGEGSDVDFRGLLAWRSSLRRFLRWSEEQCAQVGVTTGQYQLMLAVKGSPGGSPTIGDAAESLALEHHSAVGLVDRAEAAGLVGRARDPEDQHVVRVELTPLGERLISELGARHLGELRHVAGQVGPIFNDWGNRDAE